MSAQDDLLYAIKSRGAQTAQSLAAHLQLTSMGARKQLQAAQELGLVACETRAVGVGRPRQIWCLTQAGHWLAVGSP